MFEQTVSLRNGIDHIESHFHGALGMILSRFWQAGNAVVAVTKDFNSQAMVVLAEQNYIKIKCLF